MPVKKKAPATKTAATKTAAKKAAAKKTGAKKPVAKTVRKAAPKKAASKRELIEPTPGDKRYVRRSPGGQFGHTVDVGRSLAADSRSKAKKTVPKGQGDRGDTKR